MIQFARLTYMRAVIGLVTLASRRAPWVLAGAALLTAGLAWYAVTHLALTTDTADMLDPDLPFRQVNRDFDQAFPLLDDVIAVVVEGESAGAAEDVAAAISARLESATDVIRDVYRPGAGEHFERNGLLYLDVAELEDLADALAEAGPFLGTMADDPSVRGLFRMLGRALDEDLSADNERVLAEVFARVAALVEAQLEGRSASLSWRDAWLAQARPAGAPDRQFILVKPRLDYSGMQPAAVALARIREAIAAQQPQANGVRARITGDVAMETEELDNVAEDGSRVTALSLSLVCLLLVLGFRSLRLVLGVLLTLCTGLVASAAFALFAFGQLNLISVTFAVLFIGMGVDFGIQFGMRFREELERAGGDTRAALRASAHGIGGALTLAACAAAMSFFAFGPTSYRGFAELGVIAGFSMAVALGANLTVLPALLSVLGAPPRRRGGARWNPLAPLGPLIAARSGAILTLAALLVAGAALLAPQLRFDFDPLNLRDPTTEGVRTFRELLADPQTSPYTIDIVAASLDRAQALAGRLQPLAQVDAAVTLASYVPEDQPEKLSIISDLALALAPVAMGGEPRPAPTLDEQVAAVQTLQGRLRGALAQAPGGAFGAALARLASALESLQAAPGWPAAMLSELGPRLVGDFPAVLERLRALLAAEPVTLADLPEALRARYVAEDGRARVEVFPAENLSHSEAVRRFVHAVREVEPRAGGAPVVMVEAGDAVIRSCIQATALALAATVALMLVILRNPITIALALLPLLLSFVLTVGASVIAGLPINFANIIALPLLVGLSNAFGIYLVLRRRRGLDVPGLFASSTPSAIFFSGLTTMVSFGCLALARHPGMSNMGVLIGIALALALVSALLVLPALMAVLDRRGAGGARGGETG